MSRIIAALLAGSAVALAAPAFAADLYEPVPAAPVAEPVSQATAFDWTGAYVGADLGYGWGDYGITTSAGSGSRSTDGFNGGLYAGYNYAVTPNVIVGAEMDVQAGQGDKFDVQGSPVDVGTLWYGTGRGRIGYAFDNFMVYGTAGLAWAHANADFNGGSDSNTHIGWAAGGGVEAALTDNLVARAEYLYMNTSKETYTVGSESRKMDLDGSLVRLGLAYKF